MCVPSRSQPPARNATPSISTGSALAVQSNGSLLTNRHVVANCGTVAISQPGATAEAATVALKSEQLDLAILRAESPKPYVAVSRNTPVQSGEQVVAPGFPYKGLRAKEINVCTRDAGDREAAGMPPSLTAGSDCDAHGWIYSAGYSWGEKEFVCVRPWKPAKDKGFALDVDSFKQYCFYVPAGAAKARKFRWTSRPEPGRGQGASLLHFESAAWWLVVSPPVHAQTKLSQPTVDEFERLVVLVPAVLVDHREAHAATRVDATPVDVVEGPPKKGGSRPR
jgi:hypothetical protein